MKLAAFICAFLCLPVFAETIDDAEKQYQAQLETAKKDFDAKSKLAKDQFIAKLKAEMTRLTKAGDLDGALKVREKVVALDGGGEVAVAANKEKKEAPKLAAGQRLKGKLYVSCNDKVDIMYNGKVIGKSSQHNQLVPISIEPAEGESIFFVCRGGPPGVSWAFIPDNNSGYSVANFKNTFGAVGPYTPTTNFTECTTGPEWVNNSLVKRMEQSLVDKIQKPESVMVKLTDSLQKVETASYKWTFKTEDLAPFPGDKK